MELSRKKNENYVILPTSYQLSIIIGTIKSHLNHNINVITILTRTLTLTSTPTKTLKYRETQKHL